MKSSYIVKYSQCLGYVKNLSNKLYTQIYIQPDKSFVKSVIMKKIIHGLNSYFVLVLKVLQHQNEPCPRSNDHDTSYVIRSLVEKLVQMRVIILNTVGE